jgi:putative sigma-54 modulation protein
MKIEYTGRHVDVSPAIRRHVEGHFKKLDHIFNGTPLHTHVIIDVEKNRQIGEIVVQWREHTITAKDTNADMYMALTRAMAKIEKQAVKLKKKIIDRKQSARSTSRVAPEPNGRLEATPRPPRIVAARRYTVKPMTAEEAALRLPESQINSWYFAMPIQAVSVCSTNVKMATMVSSNREDSGGGQLANANL